MDILILDSEVINIETIKDEYENNSTLKLSIMSGTTEEAEIGGFIRSVKIDVPPLRLLQKSFDSGKRFERFDIAFNLGKFHFLWQFNLNFFFQYFYITFLFII